MTSRRLLLLCGPAFSGKSTLARGIHADLVVLRLPEDTIRRRTRENEATAARKGLRPDILEEHLRTFEWPGQDESPTLLTTAHAIAAFPETLGP